MAVSPLLRVVATMVLVVGGLTLAGMLLVVGPDRLRLTLEEWRPRLVERLPTLAVLGAVILVTNLLSRVSAEVAWLVGWDVTSAIYAVEGDLVASIQAVAWPPLTAYLAFAYVYGFSFLLVFPFVAYATLSEVRPFRETVAAFSANYLVGLLAYTAFIAYGPRNFTPDRVGSLLFSEWPAAHLLQSTVTLNTNVFPSLHTSFAVTVALLAWRTRESLPRWTLVATVGAASIVLATMYLGIHWATDVVAGVLVAIGCTAVAARDPLAGVNRRLQERGADVVAGWWPVSERDVGHDEDDHP